MKSSSKPRIKVKTRIKKKAEVAPALRVEGKDVKLKFEPIKLEKGSNFIRILDEAPLMLGYTRVTIPDLTYLPITMQTVEAKVDEVKVENVDLKFPPDLKVVPWTPPPPPAPRVVMGDEAIRVPPHYTEIFHEGGLKERAKAVIHTIREKCGLVDAIAVSGVSGMPLLGAISVETGIPMTIVRKEDEDLCHGYKVTGWVGSGRYIILDDLIASGKTVENIARAIHEEAKLRNQVPPTLGGIVLYHIGYSTEYMMRDGTRVPTFYAQKPWLPS